MKLIILLLCILPGFVNAQVLKGDDLLGNWISPKNDLIVKCYKENNVYKAKVLWFKRYYDKNPEDPDGLPEDQWINTLVMDHFIYEEDEWINGTIKNLKNGKVYTAYLKLISENQLNVVGYLYFRFFGESMIFKRYTSAKLPDFH